MKKSKVTLVLNRAESRHLVNNEKTSKH